jgi:hypothetical protein
LEQQLVVLLGFKQVLVVLLIVLTVMLFHELVDQALMAVSGRNKLKVHFIDKKRCIFSALLCVPRAVCLSEKLGELDDRLIEDAHTALR